MRGYNLKKGGVIIYKLIEDISNLLWAMFIVISFLLAIYMCGKTLFKIQKKVVKKEKGKGREILEPVSISLSNMIGTGAIIGVLASLSESSLRGQGFVEAICFWGLIGMVIFIPLTYCESLIVKVTGLSPREYIRKFINSKIGMVYAVSFIVLCVFGFGGFQFSGINTAVQIVSNKIFNITLTNTQTLMLVVIPMILIMGAIVWSKNHDVFVNSLTAIIGLAIAFYMLFFLIFMVNTREHVPVFFSRMMEGVKNPITMYLGLPVGIVLGFQRTVQTASLGFGALGIAAKDANNDPVTAGLISSISGMIAVIVAIFATSYITSYGVSIGTIALGRDNIQNLIGYYNTGEVVTGSLGLIAILIFSLCSGVSSLLGPYYYVKSLLNIEENSQILIYITLIAMAGVLSISGFSIIFSIVNLLLFLVCAINIYAMFKFVRVGWKEYIIEQDEEEDNDDEEFEVEVV